tara:strand:+ start:5640 stop:6788 length:1149 start_codon:yes stop_codon:yes gene_type:complete
MRLSITQKLFLAFLGLTLFTLVASLGFSRWSFERGFRDYVREREQNRLEVVREALASEYRMSNASWRSITQSRFEEIVSNSFPPHLEQDSDSNLLDRRGGPPPGPPPGPRGDRPPDSSAGRPGPPPRPAGPREDSLAAEQPSQRRRGPPTALFDADGQLLAGEELQGPPAEQFRVPVAFAGRTVGELRSSLFVNAGSPQDAAFAEQQVRTGRVIGIVAMILAAALSMLLARGLLAPVRRMITNVARLSGGDYSVRLAEPRNDELGQLMADLDHLGTTLDEDRTARQRWLANISHELRTPLTVLSGELEAMKDGVRKFDGEQLESLEQEVQRLRFLIDDLYELSVSDIGGLRYKMSAFDLNEFLQSLVSDSQSSQSRGSRHIF